jgi:hypothetical protein
VGQELPKFCRESCRKNKTQDVANEQPNSPVKADTRLDLLESLSWEQRSGHTELFFIIFVHPKTVAEKLPTSIWTLDTVNSSKRRRFNMYCQHPRGDELFSISLTIKE